MCMQLRRRLYIILTVTYICQGATLAPFHRWGNRDSKDQAPRCSNILAELSMSPGVCCPFPYGICHVRVSLDCLATFLLAPWALTQAFTDEILRLGWRLLETKMLFLKPGHFLEQPPVSCAFQPWYHHCGEQGRGGVMINMQVNCQWQRKSRMVPHPQTWVLPQLEAPSLPRRRSWKWEENITQKDLL